MKNLILVRHAKTQVLAPNTKGDFFRELADEGYNQIYEMRGKLEKILPEGDRIFSSPAIRALQTARLFTASFFPWESINEEKEIYSTTADKMIDIITSNALVNDKTVWLFGHNPTITEVAMKLSHDYTKDMSTCSVAWLKFNVSDWKEINAKNLIDFKYFEPSEF